MSAAETLTSRLGGKWHHAGYGEARCPIHDDHDPSLTIRNGERADDRVLQPHGQRQQHDQGEPCGLTSAPSGDERARADQQQLRRGAVRQQSSAMLVRPDHTPPGDPRREERGDRGQRRDCGNAGCAERREPEEDDVPGHVRGEDVPEPQIADRVDIGKKRPS